MTKPHCITCNSTNVWLDVRCDFEGGFGLRVECHDCGERSPTFALHELKLILTQHWQANFADCYPLHGTTSDDQCYYVASSRPDTIRPAVVESREAGEKLVQELSKKYGPLVSFSLHTGPPPDPEPDAQDP